jgi:membrane protein insertase Oxa1/YidC/SpoIIIJ
LISSSWFRISLKHRLSLNMSLALPIFIQFSTQNHPSILISGDETNSFVLVTGPVSLCEMIIHTFHFLFGLPWLLAPCLTILLFRLLMIPLVIYQFRNLAYFRMISPLYMRLFRSWIRSLLKGDVTGRMAFSKHLRTLTKATSIHISHSFVLLFFLILFFCLLLLFVAVCSSTL